MDDIRLLKVEYQYMEFLSVDLHTSDLQTIIVTFDYKDVRNCKVEIETELELDLYQIKTKILEALGLINAFI